jgi:hypothetical protein
VRAIFYVVAEDLADASEGWLTEYTSPEAAKIWKDAMNVEGKIFRVTVEEVEQ